MQDPHEGTPADSGKHHLLRWLGDVSLATIPRPARTVRRAWLTALGLALVVSSPTAGLRLTGTCCPTQ